MKNAGNEVQIRSLRACGSKYELYVLFSHHIMDSI